MQQPVCSFCDSNDLPGMVLRVDTREYVCRRCISDGQRAEIISLKTYHNRRQAQLEDSLHTVKQHEQVLLAELESQFAQTNQVKSDIRALSAEHHAQLSAVNSKLEFEINQTKDAKEDHRAVLIQYQDSCRLQRALHDELQDLQAAYSKIKHSKADCQALLSKHQATCQRVKLLNSKLQAKHEQFLAANQTVQRLEAERDAAKDWAARETLHALQHRQQQEIAEQQLARETSVLRFCNSKIVQNLKQSEKVKRELELQLIRQGNSRPDPDGNLFIYVKEMLPGAYALQVAAIWP